MRLEMPRALLIPRGRSVGHLDSPLTPRLPHFAVKAKRVIHLFLSALARAIASRENPLTARVMVNRVWLHHFGDGLVATPDDFGLRSDPPSHPELLDDLARRFTQGGWSLKKLHRLLMLSSVYQQASDDNLRYAMRDPDNRLLAKTNRRPLDFESMRDMLLFVAGNLDPSFGGRPFDLVQAGQRCSRVTLIAARFKASSIATTCVLLSRRLI